MKTRLLFIFSLLSLSFLAHGQESTDSIDECQFVVVYDYLCHTEDKNGNKVTDSLQLAVQVGNKVTKCAEYNATMMNDFHDRQNKEYQYGEWGARPYNVPTIYLNHPEGEMRAFDKIIPKRYLVKGAMEKTEWAISEDTLTLGGYLCHRATGMYAGRVWNVWFTENIAVSVGPWKLGGLPGLILKAEDSRRIHSFVLCGLINRKTAINYKGDKIWTAITAEKFIANRNKIMCNKRYVQNPRYYLPDGALDGAVEMWAGGPEPAPEDKYTVLAVDMVVPKTVHVYQPLELK